MINKLSPKYQQILWVNVIILSAGVGGMVWFMWHSVLYAGGAGLGIGLIEYVFMHMSLGRKQQKEQDEN